jgi:hypothetical protein
MGLAAKPIRTLTVCLIAGLALLGWPRVAPLGG